jgi:hypothetical protein
VLRSAEFDQNLIVAEWPTVIAEIIRDIEGGSDHTKYLSRRVRIGFELPRNRNKKQLRRLRAVSERTESAGFPRVLAAFADILKSSPANLIQLDRIPL